MLSPQHHFPSSGEQCIAQGRYAVPPAHTTGQKEAQLHTLISSCDSTDSPGALTESQTGLVQKLCHLCVMV